MNDIVCQGYFVKEGSWVRNWKRRYFEISRSGKITYKEEPDSTTVNGYFDISGRLECSRTKLPIACSPDCHSLIIKSTTTGRSLHVVLDSEAEYRSFCIGIAQSCKYHNLYVSLKLITSPVDLVIPHHSPTSTSITTETSSR